MQAILDETVDDRELPGIAAAVIVAGAGTWSGAAGSADRVTDLVPEAQFHVGSINKTVIASQVLRLVEDGRVVLDHRVARYLPPSLDFDTNGATVYQLLNMRSGIATPPDKPLRLGYDRHWIPLHPNREWSTERSLEFLETLPAPKDHPPGAEFEYSSINYSLLKLVIEHVMQRPLAEVLRSDVLAGPGLERMIYQTDEHPTQPVAAPLSRRYQEDVTAAFESGGGYLPSRWDGRDAIISDAPSLARWVYQLFGGEVLSSESLAQMLPVGGEGYGLGLYEDAEEWGIRKAAWAHTGILIPAYGSYFVVLPTEGIVVVALTNIADASRDLGALVGIGRELGDVARRV